MTASPHETAVQAMADRIRAGREQLESHESVRSPKMAPSWHLSTVAYPEGQTAPESGYVLGEAYIHERPPRPHVVPAHLFRRVHVSDTAHWHSPLHVQPLGESPWATAVRQIIHPLGENPLLAADIGDPRLDTVLRMVPLFKAGERLPLTVEQAIRSEGFGCIAELPVAWLSAIDQAVQKDVNTHPILGLRVMAIEATSWLQWCYVAEAVKRAAI